MKILHNSISSPSLKAESRDAPYTAKPRKHHLQELEN
jgi:hypothetical protein